MSNTETALLNGGEILVACQKCQKEQIVRAYWDEELEYYIYPGKKILCNVCEKAPLQHPISSVSTIQQ